MASNAEEITWCEGSRGVGVMTIRATNSLVIHFALDERPVDVNFVVDLTIDVVGWASHARRPGLSQLGQKMVEEINPRVMIGVDHAASGMAFGAGRDLRLVGGIQVGQAMRRQVFPRASVPSQFNVSGTRSMTSFTGHVHLKKGSGKSFCFRIKAFF